MSKVLTGAVRGNTCRSVFLTQGVNRLGEEIIYILELKWPLRISSRTSRSNSGLWISIVIEFPTTKSIAILRALLALPGCELRHTPPHIFQQIVSSVHVVALAGA